MRRDGHVVIVGAGFGGLTCARELAKRRIPVTLVDRNNYHLFTPLLYQVGSSLLNASDIAQPTRSILRGAPTLNFVQGEVTEIDFEARTVQVSTGSSTTALEYETLVLAAGSTTNFFGVPGAEQFAFGLKDLPEALELRNHVLLALERAAACTDPDERRRNLTFAVIGGGPTGVEYAGALSELLKGILPREYPRLEEQPRIVVVEMLPRVLAAFPESLSEAARRALERRGIEVSTGTRVQSIDEDGLLTADGRRIEACTIIWAAGVRPAGLAVATGLEATRGGRLVVDEYLRARGVNGVYAIGDIASFQHKGKELPMLSAPAVQQGSYLGKHLGTPEQTWKPFRYRDKGIMATIGRNDAVALFGPLKLSGFVGWVLWLTVHLFLLIGFRNRVLVFIGWAWNYLRRDRPVRIITRARARELLPGDEVPRAK